MAHTGRLIHYSLLLCTVLLSFLFIQAQGIEGGQDSWNHFLISKYAILHPELLLDQWNKPVFTWSTVMVCQMGIRALVIFNIVCVLLSGYLLALALKKQGYIHAWAMIPFMLFIPVLFQNTISGLTEPLNVLFLSLVLYFWSCEKLKLAVALSSFLPFVRTEGFVICGAICLMILFKKEYRLLYWLVLGSVVMNLAGFIITNKPFWIITENPYWKHETAGTFEAGSGSFLHYIRISRNIFGLPMLLLFAAGNIAWIFNKIRRNKVKELVTLSLLIFYAYFFAHTVIYYLGILGSHGLTRVMAVIAPPMAIVGFYGLDFLLKKLSENYRRAIYLLAVLVVIWAGYGESGYAKPYRFREATVPIEKAHTNFIKAGEWLEAHQMMHRTIVHQYPYFNVRFNKDPYDVKSSYMIWSIDQKADWANDGTIVIWDGFSALREGNMKLEWLSNNPAYKEIHFIEGFEKPEGNPTMYDVHIFEKRGHW
jgi:hypothetical protein